jgi:S-sulfosulfanyl-L-cysteine sulfohydrolase
MLCFRAAQAAGAIPYTTGGAMPRLTILQLNDLHGYLEPHPEMELGEHGEWKFATLGGLARVAGLFERVRAERPGVVITLDNGDTFHGTHVAVASKGLALVPAMNALAFDAMAVHWEFAYGPDGVQRIAEHLDYPMLAINCHRKHDDQLFLSPWRMVTRAGLRIAIIGLACPIIDKTMPPSFSEGLYFTIGNVELPRWIRHVRDEEGAELVIVLSHLGFPQDAKLAAEVAGIDILVSGHTHNRMAKAIEVNGAIIFQSGCHGSFIGRLDVEVEQGRVVGHQHALVAIDESIGPDAHVAALIDDALRAERETMAEVVGQTQLPLHRYAMLHAPMDDLLVAAIAEAAGTQVAFSNGWRYGAPIPVGPVTLGDLWNMVPMNPPISTTELTGAEIRQMIEANLERTFATDPYQQMGGYVKRMAGVQIYLRAENPEGHRIDRLFVEGEPVADERVYRCAFITEQGVPARFGRHRRRLEVHAIDALRARLRRPWPGAHPPPVSVREI